MGHHSDDPDERPAPQEPPVQSPLRIDEAALEELMLLFPFGVSAATEFGFYQLMRWAGARNPGPPN